MNLHQDWHVHSSEFSLDAYSTIAENIRAAGERGITTLGLADHARSDSTWIPVRNKMIASQMVRDDIEIFLGIEVKILRLDGALDIPQDISGIDFILIADHQYPSVVGPLEPTVVRDMIQSGHLTGRDALDCILQALINSVLKAPQTSQGSILAHPFSLLPKIGLSEAMISASQLEALGRALILRDAALEVNEKWRCPSDSVILALRNLGVRIVAGSDSHKSDDVGVYSRILCSHLELVSSDEI